MNREDIVMVCSPDISGHLRGKSFPLKDIEKRLKNGIGWVPTNVQITAFNSISDSPYGSHGDLFMIPDPAAEVQVVFGEGLPQEHFFLGSIYNTDGTPWECCLRNQLAGALANFKEETGLQVKSSFELEFQFRDGGCDFGPGFSLTGLRQKKLYGEVYLAALRMAGVEPDSFLREWGDAQYEVTMHPQLGMRAADHAVILREMARATGHYLEDPVTFTPIRDPAGAGNGVHIHMSLVDGEGRAATYDENGLCGLSETAEYFVGGMLKYLPEILAFTAPTVISYTRLTPHRWSAAFNNLGYRDREASVRVCPVAENAKESVAEKYNFEFRAADSAASPHIQLAALVHAGLEGIRQKNKPASPMKADLSLMSAAELGEAGFSRLPESLSAALDRLEQSNVVKSWFGEKFVDIYIKHKRGEIDFLAEKSEDELYSSYEKVY